MHSFDRDGHDDDDDVLGVGAAALATGAAVVSDVRNRVLWDDSEGRASWECSSMDTAEYLPVVYALGLWAGFVDAQPDSGANVSLAADATDAVVAVSAAGARHAADKGIVREEDSRSTGCRSHAQCCRHRRGTVAGCP